MKTLTPKGFARLLARGVEATYAQNAQRKRLVELANMFDDFTMARAMDAESGEGRRAFVDADFLDGIADEIEEIVSSKHGWKNARGKAFRDPARACSKGGV